MSSMTILLWLHILANVGAFGALLAFQYAVPKETRSLSVVSRRISLVVNAMIGTGLVAGLAYYLVMEGYTYSAHYNGVIGMKFLFLLAVGALVGISKKSRSGDTLRSIALILLALAAFFGLTV